MTRNLMRKLHVALATYTLKSSVSYNEKFDRAIRAAHPEWFVTTSDKKKIQLLSIKPGDSRPKPRTSLYLALENYTRKNSGCYDREFDAAIRLKHPDWWPMIVKKQQLLAMPVGSPRPTRQNRHPLGTSLDNYVRKKSSAYDAEFDAAIRARQPQWFVRPTREKKQALLELSEGCPRPNYRTLLGMALNRFLFQPGPCYDAEFDAAIRARQPGWFKKESSRVLDSGCVLGNTSAVQEVCQ